MRNIGNCPRNYGWQRMPENPPAPDMRRRELVLAEMNPRSAFDIADMVAGGSIEGARMGRAHIEAARDAGWEADGTTIGGPRAKTAKVAGKGARELGFTRHCSPGGSGHSPAE